MYQNQEHLFKGYRFPPSIIQHAVWLYFTFPLSFRDIEISINHDDTVSTVKTDLDGKTSFLPIALLSDSILVESFFAGDDNYSSSTASLVIYTSKQTELKNLEISPPSGFSILIISAPISPNFMVQKGPAKIRVRSKILI